MSEEGCAWQEVVVVGGGSFAELDAPTVMSYIRSWGPGSTLGRAGNHVD